MKKIILKILSMSVLFVLIFMGSFPVINYATTNVESDMAKEESDEKEQEITTQENAQLNNKIEEKKEIEVQENKTDNQLEEKEIAIQENKQLEEGIYTISSKINKNMVIEVPNKSKEEAVKVQLANKSKGINKSQEIKVKNIGNGYYTLIFEHSSKVLDVPGASKKSEVQLQQYSSNNTMAQQWIIKETGDGYYYIISGCSGLYVDIPGGHADEKTKIQLYQGNGTDAQKFSFTKVEELKTDKIENGTYYITSALAQNKVISIEEGKQNDFANAYIWENKKREYQKFDVIYNKESDAYIITAVHSNKSLDVSYAGQSNGSNVAQYQTHKGDTEQWILKKTADGYYNIISKCNYLNLDIDGARTANGTNIQMYEGNGTNAQKFKFVKADTIKSTKTIENGVYNIVTKSNANKVLQIENTSLSNNAKAKCENKLNVINKSQAFEIKYLNNGYYQIKQQKSLKVLEVNTGDYHNETKIIQKSEDKNSTMQQWIIKDAGDGYFYIISKCNGLFIDIPGGNVENNPVIQMYEGNGTDAQKFKFVKANQEIEEGQVLENGVYKIKSALNNNKCVDVSDGSYDSGANVHIWDNCNVQQQKFEITYNAKQNYYEIKSVNSGKVLDVQSKGKADGSNVWQYEANNTDAQKWILQSAGNGYYYIIAVNSYLCLDVSSGNTNNGTNVQIYEGNETKSQMFKFEKAKMIDSDSYNITLKQDENKVIDVDAGSTLDGANVQIWTFDSVNQQIFKIEYIDDKYCRITARHSDKVLTVEKNNVVQTEYDGADKQLWSFEIAGSGYYKIKSKSTNLYLDIVDNKTANGTNVQVHTANTSNAQKFRFKELSIKYGIDVSAYNGNVNWSEVRKSGRVDYAIIRAGYRGYGTGKIVTDKKFERNVKEATKNGIDIGLYFFTQAVNEQEAIEEANYVLDLVKKYKVNVKYPIVIDTEYSTSNGEHNGRADKLDIATRTAVCRAFCDTIKNAGYTPAVYANRNWFYDNLDVNQLNNCDIWVAQYTGDVNKTTDYRYRYNMWQYTSSESVPGVNAPVKDGKANVDMSICYKKY